MQQQHEMQRGAVPIAKMISRNTTLLQDANYASTTTQKRAQPKKKKRRKSQNKTNSYLDDVLIEEDVKNVNALFNPSTSDLRPQEQYMQEFTPRQRIQIKKDLNDHYQENFNNIEGKDYDRIIGKPGEATSFNFNKFSGW